MTSDGTSRAAALLGAFLAGGLLVAIGYLSTGWLGQGHGDGDDRVLPAPSSIGDPGVASSGIEGDPSLPPLPDKVREAESGGPVVDDGAAAPEHEVMPLERVLELAGAHFEPNEQRNEALRSGWGPWLTGLSRYRVSRKLAMKLTEAQYAEVLEMEAGFNRDLDALATLYVDDYNHALQEVWVTKQWHFEEPIDPVRGTFREALPGESVLEFPGRAIYYSVPFERYPHLQDHLDQRRELVLRRKREIVDWAVATRDEKWFPQPGDEQDFE